MSESPHKSSWESLLSILGVTPSAEAPPPPAAPEETPVQPVQGTPSQASMRPAPKKAAWQELAQSFGISVPEEKPAAARPAEPPARSLTEPPARSFTEPPARNFMEPAAQSLRQPEPAPEAPIILNPLAADTYKFEVIEEREIEFTSFQSVSEVSEDFVEPFAPQDPERSNEAGEGQRRRRRRRRRGGRRDRSADAGGQGSTRREDEAGIPNRYYPDEPPQSAAQADAKPGPFASDLNDDELDAIEEAARREDLGLPPLDHRRRSEPGRGRRRRRRGGTGRRDDRERGRGDAPREPLPDGVAHGDEYDILDDRIDEPAAAERPYGGHDMDADDSAAHDEHHDQEDAEGEGNTESLHRNIHTWEQTVGTIISKNMESRARFPGASQPRGRGRGRPRGRGRGRGGSRGG